MGESQITPPPQKAAKKGRGTWEIILKRIIDYLRYMLCFLFQARLDCYVNVTMFTSNFAS